jgi:hypothetical protein
VAPDGDSSVGAPVDGRMVTYRIARYLLLVALAAAALKLLILDTMLIRTDQMAPTLAVGDRVVVFKLFHTGPLSAWFVPFRRSPVIFGSPVLAGKPSCLRVAAVSGDTVMIGGGTCRILNKHAQAFSSKAPGEELLPAEYSPRDSMPPYCLPRPGSTVNLDSLPLRDFFFASALIRQENPKGNFAVRPALFVDGVLQDSVRVRDFSLFKGALDSVPERFAFDWFFWDRLRDYLEHSQKGNNVFLSFSLLQSGVKMYEYTFTKSCIFLLADDWQKGFDSRYFGPVLAASVKGRVIGVVWSFGATGDKKSTFRITRLFKIIR